MRTTLTIADDVAAKLERLRRTRRENFKDIVNEVLRRGLRDIEGGSKRRKPFRTRGFDVGQPFFDNVDNIEDVIEAIEGPLHK